jgi:hypothetical protein
VKQSLELYACCLACSAEISFFLHVASRVDLLFGLLSEDIPIGIRYFVIFMLVSVKRPLEVARRLVIV